MFSCLVHSKNDGARDCYHNSGAKRSPALLQIFSYREKRLKCATLKGYFKILSEFLHEILEIFEFPLMKSIDTIEDMGNNKTNVVWILFHQVALFFGLWPQTT